MLHLACAHVGHVLNPQPTSLVHLDVVDLCELGPTEAKDAYHGSGQFVKVQPCGYGGHLYAPPVVPVEVFDVHMPAIDVPEV